MKTYKWHGVSEEVKAGEEGFSLVELMIGATLVVVLLTAVFAIMQSVVGGYEIQAAQADAQSSAQLALMQMTADIRQAEKPIIEVTSFPGFSERLVFKADLNDDGVSEMVRYSYSYSSKTLTKRVNPSGVYSFTDMPREALVFNVANNYGSPMFTYYGTSLTAPLDPYDAGSDIINKTKLIKVRIVVDKDATKPPAAIDLSSELKLRNFGY